MTVAARVLFVAVLLLGLLRFDAELRAVGCGTAGDGGVGGKGVVAAAMVDEFFADLTFVQDVFEVDLGAAKVEFLRYGLSQGHGDLAGLLTT